MTPEELAAKLKDKSLLSAFKTRLMTKVTLTALAKSQPHTPVRTGTLRRSETTRVEKGGDRGFLGSNLSYSAFVHKRIPFFELGIADSSAEIQRLLQAAGDDYLDQISR